jgi:hypothetical protein
MNGLKKIKNFTPSELSYSEVNTNTYGGKSVYVNDGNSRIVLQLPRMSLPYNVSAFKPLNEPDAEPKYTWNLSFRDMDSNARVKNCYEVFDAFDNAIIDAGVRFSKEWFGEEHPRQVIKAFYSPTIKRHREGKYPPTIKMKLPRRKGEFTPVLFDEKNLKDPVDLTSVDICEYVGKGTEASTLITTSQIWFAGGKFGCSWSVLQARVKPSKRFTNVCMIEESDDEDEADNTTTTADTVTASGEDNDDDEDELDNIVVDSSDDEDDEPEPEPEPEPAPATKKKTRKKKTKKT